MRDIIDYCIEDAMNIDASMIADGWVPWGPPTVVRMPAIGGQMEDKLVQALVMWGPRPSLRAGETGPAFKEPCEFCGGTAWTEGDAEAPRPWCSGCGREKGARA